MSGGALPVSISLASFYLVLVFCTVYFFYTTFGGLGLAVFLAALVICLYILR